VIARWGLTELVGGAELKLASGRVLGHRALKTTYKQRRAHTSGPVDETARLAIANNLKEAETRFVRKWVGDEAAALVAAEPTEGFTLARARHEAPAAAALITTEEKVKREGAAERSRRLERDRLDVGIKRNLIQSKYFKSANYIFAD
jgi:hypothetical protein